jgi:hypothetical protein
MSSFSPEPLTPGLRNAATKRRRFAARCVASLARASACDPPLRVRVQVAW